MDKVEAELFVLTNSFRFTKEIGDKANNFLTKFRNEKLNINGRAESREILPEDDTVAYLTRSNAKLISIIAEFMVQEKPIKVVRDPELIFGLAINMERLKFDRVSSIDEDFHYLKSFAKDWERLTLKDDNEFETIFEYIVSIIQDEEDEIVRTIKLLEKYKYIDPIYQYALKYYKTDENILTSVTTAHAAKGLEWEHVIVENDFPEWGKLIAKWFKSVDKDPAKIAHPFQYFVKNCKKQEYIDEFNLYYVAITRGKYLVEDHTWFNNLPEQESEYDEHIMNAFSEDIKIKVGKKKKSKKNLLIPY
jgi:superfamily I DNA/RNA helicase